MARDPAPDLRTLRPQVSAPLAALVARALHKQPARRQADAHALADELAALQDASGPHAKAAFGA